jgi:hypothetical protein
MGNQSGAARIAREIVKELAPSDIEWLINAKHEEYERLYTAVYPNYPNIEKQRRELEKQIEAIASADIKPLLDEYGDHAFELEGIKQTAWFNLGFAAALRLLGTPPQMNVINGGVTETKLRGRSKL